MPVSVLFVTALKQLACTCCAAAPLVNCVLCIPAGTAIVEGHDIRMDMNAVYSLMGVCPQTDLLWAELTAAEHLRFYGRLKGLKVRAPTPRPSWTTLAFSAARPLL